jgi:UDP-glucose 4-epimerase
MSRPARLISLPPSLLAIVGALTGQGDSMRRLTQSLEVDSSPSAVELGFSPVISLDESVRLTVAADGYGQGRRHA